MLKARAQSLDLDVWLYAGTPQKREYLVDWPVLRIDRRLEHHVAQGMGESGARLASDARRSAHEPGAGCCESAYRKQPRVGQDRRAIVWKMVEHGHCP